MAFFFPRKFNFVLKAVCVGEHGRCYDEIIGYLCNKRVPWPMKGKRLKMSNVDLILIPLGHIQFDSYQSKKRVAAFLTVYGRNDA